MKPSWVPGGLMTRQHTISGSDDPHNPGQEVTLASPPPRWSPLRPAFQPEVSKTRERGGVLPRTLAPQAWPTHSPYRSTTHKAPRCLSTKYKLKRAEWWKGAGSSHPQICAQRVIQVAHRAGAWSRQGQGLMATFCWLALASGFPSRGC